MKICNFVSTESEGLATFHISSGLGERCCVSSGYKEILERDAKKIKEIKINDDKFKLLETFRL